MQNLFNCGMVECLQTINEITCFLGQVGVHAKLFIILNEMLVFLTHLALWL